MAILHPALTDYLTNGLNHTVGPEGIAALTRDRQEARAKLVRQKRRARRLARLRCPECHDSLRISLQNRWICQHCLCTMTPLGR